MSSVFLIPKLKDAKTKHDADSGNEKQQKSTFSTVLKKTAAAMDEPEVIRCETNGYSKDARVLTYLYSTREYKNRKR